MGIAKEFIFNLKGREYPVYGGCLDAATKAGLRSLTTEIVQIPGPENGHMAVVMATARFEDGREFVDVGDCSQASTSPMLAAAALRLASTRAKGRVLRDAINVGMTLLEELPDTDALSAPAAEASRAERAARPQEPGPNTQRPTPKPEGNAGAAPICATESCHKPLTKGQYEFSLRAFSQPLCPACQKLQAKVAP